MKYGEPEKWVTPEKDKFFSDRQHELGKIGFRTWNTASKWVTSFRTVVDIGAHIGTHSFVYANFFEEVKSFEPLYFEECEQNLLHIDNCIIYPYGISDTNKPGKIVRSNNNSGATVVITEENINIVAKSGNINSKNQMDINLKTLDEFNFENVDFIKSDTEGYVYPMLIGMENTLRKWKPVLQLEMNYLTFKERESREFLSEIGYKEVDKEDKDYFFVCQ